MKDNRYARKRQHKRKLKKKHAILFSVFDVGLDERESRREYAEDKVFRWRDSRNGGYHYWDNYSLSGAKAYAKYCTNRKIRAKFRNILTNKDPEEVVALTGSQYEKEFDFWWTVL